MLISLTSKSVLPELELEESEQGEEESSDTEKIIQEFDMIETS